MSKIRAILTTGVFFTAFSAMPAASADSIQGRFSVSTRMSLASAAYDDLNGYFDAFNAGTGILASNYESYADFTGGTGFDVDLRYGFTENFAGGIAVGLVNDEVSVAQGWEFFNGERIQDNLVPFGLERTVKVEVVPLMISGFYYIPIIDGVRAYGGTGLGVFGVRLISDSVHDMNPTDSPLVGNTYTDFRWGRDPLDSGTRYWSGSDAGIHLTLGAEYSLSNHLVISGDAQYRNATVRELIDPEEETFVHYVETTDEAEADFEFVEEDGVTVHFLDATSTPVEIDLTGFQLSLGVRLYF